MTFNTETGEKLQKYSTKVLNLVINGWPSILTIYSLYGITGYSEF